MTRDQINAKYRRDYDRLYIASMKADSAEESERIDGRLAALNTWRDRQLSFLDIQADNLGLDLKKVLR